MVGIVGTNMDVDVGHVITSWHKRNEVFLSTHNLVFLE